MGYLSYLQQGVTKTFHSIKNNKVLFIALIVLQLLFLVSLSAVMLQYQVKILNAIEGIAGPLERANYDPQSIEAGAPFTEEFLTIYRQYALLTEHIRQGLLWTTALFLLGSSLLWIGSHRVIYGKMKIQEIGKAWLKFLLTWGAVYGPAALIGFFLLRSIITAQAPVASFSSTLRVLFYVFLGLYYFVLTGLAFITIPSWKRFWNAILRCGIRTAAKTIPLLALMVMLILASLYGVALTLQSAQPFALVIGATIIALAVIVTMRLLWIATLRELYEHHL